MIYPQIQKNPASIYSFLVMAGYLKIQTSVPSYSGDSLCEVAIPNQEIAYVYNKEILEKLQAVVPQSIANSLQEALYLNDEKKIQHQIQKILIESVSCYDTVGENFYHGLVLGLCALVSSRYYISSNRESGEGRYDIQLMPRDITKSGIIIEIKAIKDCSDEGLRRLAQGALAQINEKKYETEMVTKGVSVIYKYGIAFSGKKVEIVALRCDCK